MGGDLREKNKKKEKEVTYGTRRKELGKSSMSEEFIFFLLFLIGKS
jgi:hypothetical protein